MARQHPAQVVGLGGADPVHGVPAGTEEHRDRQPGGPVGSSTTSRQTPGVVPVRAARSTSTRLARVGTALRRHTIVPSPESTRTVWALVIPRSIPTSRRSCMPPPCWLWPAPAAPMGDAVPRPRSQGAGVRRRLPLMCCNRPRPRRAGPLPASGASVAGQGWQSGQRGMATARRPQSCTQRHPRNQPGCACNPGTPVWIKHRGPLHELQGQHTPASRGQRRSDS